MIVSNVTLELILMWISELAAPKCKLPSRGLQAIELDITPVPGYARQRSKAWVAWLVNHSSVSNRMWNMYESDTARVTDSLATWMQITAQNQQPLLKVTGTVSPKTRLRMPTVLYNIMEAQLFGLKVAFESDYLDDSEVLKLGNGPRDHAGRVRCHAGSANEDCPTRHQTAPSRGL